MTPSMFADVTYIYYSIDGGEILTKIFWSRSEAEHFKRQLEKKEIPYDERRRDALL